MTTPRFELTIAERLPLTAAGNRMFILNVRDIETGKTRQMRTAAKSSISSQITGDTIYALSINGGDGRKSSVIRDADIVKPIRATANGSIIGWK